MIQRRLMKAAAFGIAIAGLLTGAGKTAEAQVYAQQYAMQPAPSPQSGYPVPPAGCYGSPPTSAACYSYGPPRGDACYSRMDRPNYPHDHQLPGTPDYWTLCHDTATVTHTVYLTRYYPVYVHLQAKKHEGVHIEEVWKPLCKLCTPEHPCPRHEHGQMPSDLPPPATGGAPATPQAAADAPAPSSAVADQPQAVQPAAPVATQPAPPTPAPPMAPPAQAAAPQKRWVYLTAQNLWAYGYQRADGLWVVDQGTKRSTPPAS